MNRETALKQLAIMQAWADGKTIQYRLVGTAELSDAPFKDFSRDAMDSAPAVFNIESYEWRIKPEPRQVWLIEWMDDSVMLCRTEREYEMFKPQPWSTAKVSKFIEVIE